MPRCSVIFTDKAESDLRRITYYLFDNDFDTNKVFEIRRETERVLSERANGGIIFDEKRGIRKILILKVNSVYYSINGETVNVIHIRAGKMNRKI